MRNLIRNVAPFAVRAAVLLLLVLCAAAVHAQDSRILLAGGGLPGVGVMAIHSTPTLFVFTREVAVYGDYTVGGSNRLLVAVGVGGSVQIARILEIVQNRAVGATGLDVGLRLGPSFYYSLAKRLKKRRVRSASCSIRSCEVPTAHAECVFSLPKWAPAHPICGPEFLGVYKVSD